MDITPKDRALGAQVRAQIEASPGNGFALIDGALCPTRRRPWLQQAPSVVVAPRSCPQSTAQALPYLIELAAIGQTQLAETMILARETSGVTWLASTLSVRDLAVALSLRMEAVLPQSLPIFLRLADARVLPVIHMALSESQRASFFNGISTWCYLDRRHELTPLQLPTPCEAHFNPPLYLTEAQEQALLKAAEPDAVLHLLSTHDNDALEGVAAAERHAFVVQQMARAAQWGLTASVDMALYCSMALTHGHDFDRQAEWSAQLQDVKLGRLTLWQLINLR